MDVPAQRRPLSDLDQRVQLGLGAGLLMVVLGVFALPWVEFDQALGGGTSFGFDELRRAFGELDGNDRLLGNLLIWLAAAVFGLGFGIESLIEVGGEGSAAEKQYLPALPLGLCVILLWRINHYISDAAGVFIQSGVDARIGAGGVLTACGCAVVLGAVIWGHQLESTSTQDHAAR